MMAGRLIANPKGIPTQSPGLRGTSYPGKLRPMGNQPQRGCGPFLIFDSTTPSGLIVVLSVIPRVARASQPWAGGRNPFGIEQRLDDFRVSARANCRSPEGQPARTPLGMTGRIGLETHASFP